MGLKKQGHQQRLGVRSEHWESYGELRERDTGMNAYFGTVPVIFYNSVFIILFIAFFQSFYMDFFMAFFIQPFLIIIFYI